MSSKVKKSIKHKKKDNVLRKIIIFLVLFGLSLAILMLIGRQTARNSTETVAGSERVVEDSMNSFQNLQTSNAFLQFDPSTRSVQSGEEFDINVVVNTGGAQILSTEAYILFNSSGTNLQILAVEDGDFFPTVSFAIDTNTLVIRGMVNEPAAYREGTGIMATIKLKALQSGNTPLNFYCNLEASNTSKIIQNDIDAQNVINCGSNQAATISIAGGSQATITISQAPTDAESSPTKKPTPTNKPNERDLKIIAALILIIFIILMIILGI